MDFIDMDTINSRGMKAALRYLEIKGFDVIDVDGDWIFAFDPNDDRLAVVFVQTDVTSLATREIEVTRKAFERTTAMFLTNNLDAVKEHDNCPVCFDQLDIQVLSNDRAFLRHAVGADGKLL